MAVRRLRNVAIALMLLIATEAANAQIKVRGLATGFTTAVTSGDRFGIKASAGDALTGLTEASAFKIGSGFLFADSEAKVPQAAEDDGNLPEEIPREFELHQNYPNPFNPVTSIHVSLPRSASTRIEIYNMLGQIVSVLVDKDLPAGLHRFEWDARDVTGRPVSSGVYVYRLVAGDFATSRTMALLK